MAARPKLLLLDDDQELLDMYREILSQMPSKPEIQTASSGARAIALLESQRFTLMITDLNMPKMDGLQVLSIVRRKYPQLRIVVLTSVMDEQFRSRSYAMGVDLFWQKPSSVDEIQQFLECIESLLGREVQETGFRGVQSKSLVDIIQLEGLSRSSTTLRIVNGRIDGKIWMLDGDVIDAETSNLGAKDAFQEILSWKNGSFEVLPFDENRKRTIFESVQGLLLETAQAIDEAQLEKTAQDENGEEGAVSPLVPLSRIPGVEFLIDIPDGDGRDPESWAAENVEQTAQWGRETMKGFRELGEKLQAGQIMNVEFHGQQGHISCSPGRASTLMAGWVRNMSNEDVRENLKALTTKWDS
jgi:CheY-like chemotaxis protein